MFYNIFEPSTYVDAVAVEPVAAGQLPDVVAHGIKADAALRLGVGICRRPPGLALQAIFLHQIFHAIDDGPITTTSSELPTGL